MGPVTGISIYILIWWVVFLAVLPHGSQSFEQRGETPPPGVDPGVPFNPNLKKKVWVTSAIALVLFAILWLVIRSGLLALPPVAKIY